MKKAKIGIIGCGAIGTALAHFVEKELSGQATLCALCDKDAFRARALHRALKKSRPLLCDIEGIIKKSDIVIESATKAISYHVAKAALLKGRKVLILSIGGIIDKIGELRAIAKKHGGFLYLPSGAISGLDGLQALALAGIKKIMITTRKPPRGLEGVAYIAQKGIDLKSIRKETVVFEGNAMQAIRYFPQNINVAALLSIAGIGAKKTRVKIMTSPAYTRNTHEIVVESKAGRIVTVCENVAFAENPKTSYLAALSAQTALKNIFDCCRVGN